MRREFTEAERAFKSEPGIHSDIPTPGYYLTRMAKGGVDVAVRIWFGQPLDPVTHEPLDRSHCWNATRDGEPVEVSDVWPYCAKRPSNEVEHDYIVAIRRWARENEPNSPEANPRRAVDWKTYTPKF